MSDGFGYLKPVEQVAREHEAKQRKTGTPAKGNTKTYVIERPTAGPGQAPKMTAKEKVKEIRQKFEAQKAQEKQRGGR